MTLPRPPLRMFGIALFTFFLLGLQHEAQTLAEPPETFDGWVRLRDEQTGIQIQTKELTLHPRAETKPALKYRLLPDPFDAVRGNAAIYYLKAMGFLEQDSARERLFQLHKESVADARKRGQDFGEVAPYVWLSTEPEKLPVKEVNEYLQLLSFQPPILREAARRTHFDMDRNFREVEDPIAYLLPEIQKLRELSRNQSMRCRLAIKEERIDDAIEILGQQFALARHLGDDEFLVSNLVGIAIAGIAWNDMLYVVQHPEAPNLYWALSAMPSPLVDMRRSMAVERQFLYQQLKVLREVDETPRPAGYWQDFIDRLLPQLGYVGSELKLPSVEDDRDAARAALVGYIAAAYPGARDYLIEVQKLPRKQVEAYPTAQVVFLAMVRFHNHWRDEFFKWVHLPYWQVRARSSSNEKMLTQEVDRYGWCTLPTQLLLPAVFAARTARARCGQTIALVQTVEAIRMYAGTHDGRLPPTLDMLTVPAPLEPFTGKPIDYELVDDRAVLSGHALPGMRYRLILRIAK